VPTFARYLLIQLPGVALIVAGLAVARRFIELPTGALVLLAAAWIAKDLALYPLLRHAYEVDPRTEMEKLAGEEVVVRTSLDPGGFVLLQGELWRAEAAAGERLPVPAGTRMSIESHRGLVLVVRAIQGEAPTRRQTAP
jgi:membrane protein implicated in regulation of membrane protease activity